MDILNFITTNDTYQFSIVFVVGIAICAWVAKFLADMI